MQRIPEPELMNAMEQAKAYSEADFEEPHEAFVEVLKEKLRTTNDRGYALDLGCGPGDVSLRFARVHPHLNVHGVDGAPNMIQLGEARIREAGFSHQVELVPGYLPGASLQRDSYEVIFSNSLLHHLKDPMVLWDTIHEYASPGTGVFVMDLCRPQSVQEAKGMVDRYAANEPEILRHDFYHSLCAAYRPQEVREQLDASNVSELDVQALGDRHLIIWGRIGNPS